MRPSRSHAPAAAPRAATLRAATLRAALVAVAALVASLLPTPAAAAPRAATVLGSEPRGYGRLALTFDAPVKVSVRVSGTVLVATFSEPAAIRAEHIAEEMPGYVGFVRRDPDGTGLRLALTRPYRLSVLEAGERVFVDLLPETWTGLPPGLPQDVVDDLARRAREAEARAKRLAPAPRPPETLALRVAELPTLLRLVFPVPAGIDVAYEARDGAVRLAVARPYQLDESAARGRLLPRVRAMSAETTPDALHVSLTLAPDVEPRGFREEDSFVLDLAPKGAKASPAKTVTLPLVEPTAPAAHAEPVKAAEAARPVEPVRVAEPAKPVESAKASEATKPPEPVRAADPPKAAEASKMVASPKAAEPGRRAEAGRAPPPSAAAQPSRILDPPRSTDIPKPTAPGADRPSGSDRPPGPDRQSGSDRPSGPDRAAGPVRATLVAAPDSLRLAFPFAARTPAALFERGGVATLVFETTTPIALPAAELRAGGILTPQGEPERAGAFTVLRFAVGGGPRLLALAPDGGTGWTLATDGGLAPREPLAATRTIDAGGRTALLVPLARPGGALWLAAERIAVVTASGPPAGVPKPGRFVEFELLPTVQGVAVLALADDLLVTPGIDGVTVARGGGLAMSLAPSGGGEADPGIAPAELAVARERWIEDGRGDVGTRLRERALAAAEAPRSERSAARLDLARTLMAAGLNPEAATVMTFAAADDPTFERRRGVAVLRGIAAARMRRDAEALRFLSGDAASDPEARLWRAALDARAGRWSAALAGFRRGAGLVEAYPDDLQAELRALAARAGIEEGDLGYAEAELAAADARALDGPGREGLALLRARLAQAAGRPEAALDAYRRLAAEADRPTAAEATVRGAELGLAEGKLPRDEAIAALEAMNVWWRGDEVEARTLGRLARLYAEAGRWRDAFTAARRANRLYPEYPATRDLHEDTTRLFEELFLSGRGASLPRIETLALYFDFKEFAPIGRRGDEIVRRLADRLVELDLLDAAGDLLDHQVRNRLTGAARATVAARLATIRLMEGKPAAALGALHLSRLAELPGETRRARALLEARALSDLTRTDLALDVVSGERGPEAERLRADILWGARRWREAGEAHEGLVGERWRGPDPLTDADRADIIRAGIAYALAEEPIGLDRLRAKFAARMSESADARTFAFLCQPNAAGTRAFRDLARSAASAETLTGFLAAYRKRYPEAAAAARPAREPEVPG